MVSVSRVTTSEPFITCSTSYSYEPVLPRCHSMQCVSLQTCRLGVHACVLTAEWPKWIKLRHAGQMLEQFTIPASYGTASSRLRAPYPSPLYKGSTGGTTSYIAGIAFYEHYRLLLMLKSYLRLRVQMVKHQLQNLPALSTLSKNVCVLLLRNKRLAM